MYKLQFLCCKFSNLNRQYRRNRVTTNYFILTQQFSFIITHFCYITCFFCWWWRQTVIYNQSFILTNVARKTVFFPCFKFFNIMNDISSFQIRVPLYTGCCLQKRGITAAGWYLLCYFIITFWLSIRKRFSEFLGFLITQMVRIYAKI